ncbi:bifunctional phosphopantothenoylcysteine decarboxylase/phosphopantothenate--cysteine ligase CoaBC [Selenomonas ruminis]|uniref:Coenzyme A biosynthesis bifunctional protein CoaBC n=1 Tax=Selenomonas ruminis TaxID=2593411 RepID=A0A5D6WB46_9FIRM|nr:bifunctional phosphopantothenoylcysteine decarboxylase/phosphopantothenate--cysteine ligase CoaBC [Selenomonas sp. mPRGC5]TYZ25020.1 bifunctional phosphopantothenoylcysteine decarboxylase/phosphopantothenate--cysteine ligase CoaBC [Selenomonas sp. mPRGC5]
MELAGKKIVLGVTGGIAAYKAVEIVSRLRKAGAEVHVIMTKESTQFVTELTFREISGQPVVSDMWEKVTHFNVEHIALAQLADLMLIAPATANIIAKAAVGIADDMLSTTILATKAPVYMAPAMNTNMYENPITQRNIAELKSRGFHIIEPAAGHLACGTSGKGRLPEPVDIVGIVREALTSQKLTSQTLTGQKILVTAGGTIEPLDPVRYIGNRSTGRMGYAVAAEAARRGADVVLVSGPSALADPVGVRVIRIETARQMREAVLREFPTAAAVIKSAAVADYRPAVVADQKIKKSDEDLTLKFVRNPDILLELGQKKEHQVLVGFAAETCQVEEYARRKLSKKNLDFIVANDVSEADAGFGVDTNRIKLIDRSGKMTAYPLMSKKELAGIILDHVATVLNNSQQMSAQRKQN